MLPTGHRHLTSFCLQETLTLNSYEGCLDFLLVYHLHMLLYVSEQYAISYSRSLASHKWTRAVVSCRDVFLVPDVEFLRRMTTDDVTRLGSCAISLVGDTGYFCSSAVSSLSSEHFHSSLLVHSVCVPPKSRAEPLTSHAGALRGGRWDVIGSCGWRPHDGTQRALWPLYRVRTRGLLAPSSWTSSFQSRDKWVSAYQPHL